MVQPFKARLNNQKLSDKLVNPSAREVEAPGLAYNWLIGKHSIKNSCYA